jgi:hypothetical protein
MKPDRCPTCKRVKKRSNESNRRYWLLLHVIADKLKPEGKQFSAESWHLYFKQRYLGCDDIALPNGKVIVRPRSSAELDKQEFAEYMYAVEAWANEHDVYLDEEVAA